jgi:hypothetical protein
VPFIPVEIMLLPKWFPFHLNKVSYWSRTVMVPLFILCTYKVKARNQQKMGIAELFVTPPDEEKNYFSHVKTPLGKAILVLDRMGRLMAPLIPGFVRRKATVKARNWFMARLNGYDDLGQFSRPWSMRMKPWIIWASLPTMNSGGSPRSQSIACWLLKMIRPTASPAFPRFGIPDWWL